MTFALCFRPASALPIKREASVLFKAQLFIKDLIRDHIGPLRAERARPVHRLRDDGSSESLPSVGGHGADRLHIGVVGSLQEPETAAGGFFPVRRDRRDAQARVEMRAPSRSGGRRPGEFGFKGGAVRPVVKALSE